MTNHNVCLCANLSGLILDSLDQIESQTSTETGEYLSIAFITVLQALAEHSESIGEEDYETIMTTIQHKTHASIEYLKTAEGRAMMTAESAVH